MYNGIGLPTPWGSGTNGYLQQNLSAALHNKDLADYKSEEELRKLESSLVKKPNQDILDHERKRKIELKCLELAELMEEQGYGEWEIQEKVATFRMILLEKDVAVVKEWEQQQKSRSTSESASQKDHRDCSSSPDGSSTSDASHSRSGSPIVQKRSFLRRQSKSPLSSSRKPDTEVVSKNLGEKEHSSSAEPAWRGRSTSPRESREKQEVKYNICIRKETFT
uniref:CWF21 domain-containing protein n=1 Tax=Micrurus carvalhoi TaxID=3147026 RepID=A0A2H6N8N0_9SAUR